MLQLKISLSENFLKPKLEFSENSGQSYWYAKFSSGPLMLKHRKRIHVYVSFHKPQIGIIFQIWDGVHLKLIFTHFIINHAFYYA